MAEETTLQNELPGMSTEQPKYILEITETLENVIIHENDVAVFECKIESKLLPQCAWYKDGRLITHTQTTRISNNGKWHRLEISSAKSKDEGVYTIICRSGKNCVSSKATLHIAPASCIVDKVFYTNAFPKRSLVITRHLTNVKIMKGEKIELEVQVEAEFDVEYVWFRNNEILTQNERIMQLNSNSGSKLSIKKTAVSDSGIYYAVVKSNLVTASSITDVQVLEEEDFSPDSEAIPNIEEHLPHELEVNETEEIRMICQAASDLNTSIRWYKNKTAINGSNYVPEDYGNHYMGLKIVKASRSDSGNYTIILRDENTGRVDSTSCYLTVNPLPPVSVPLVSIKRPLESVIACCGSKVSLDCCYELEDPKYFYVVWYIGHFRVERTNSRFVVACDGGEFLLYIRSLETTMSGEVVCELRKCLPNVKSVFINSTTSTLTVLPTHIVENERDSTVYQTGKIYRQKNEINRFGNNAQNGANGHEQEEKNDGKDILMEICYCRLESDGTSYIRAMRRDNVIFITHLGVSERMKEVGPGNRHNIVIEWNDSVLPTSVWYIIEVGLKTGGYIQAGFTSVSTFEVRYPNDGQMLRFRIKTMVPKGWTDSFVSIEPSPGEVEKPALTHELKPMDLFDPTYTETGNLIGSGAFGSVILVQDKAGHHFAAKILKTRTKKKRDTARREFEMMKNLCHPKLVKLIDAYICKDTFILVMDYLWGGELFDRIVEEEHIKEVDVVPYVRQICEALQYLHEHRIAHLDLKPENIICMSPNSGQVKIIDFGLARVLEEGHVTRAIYGTRDYVAPEVLNFERLTLACDMWSLGVVTYMLLSGVMPFAGENWPERSANITMANYNYDDIAFSEISGLAKDFVDHLLVVSPGHRLSASKALNHSWLLEGPPKGTKPGYMKKARENLKSYLANYRSKWQRAGNVMIAAMRLRTTAHSNEYGAKAHDT